jgi:hypothetical protein
MKILKGCERAWGVLQALVVGVALLGAANCGEEADQVETTRGAITNGWTNLTLINGWQNYNGTSNPPAVGMINGITVFRGALKASNPTSVAFATLPAAFQPNPNGNFIEMRVALAGSVGGSVVFNFTGGANTLEIYEDGTSPAGFGPASKTMTSLDGASFDQAAGTALVSAGTWHSHYGFRQLDPATGSYVKLVNGFVRFQGFLQNSDTNPLDYTGLVFNIPSQFRPGNTVLVPLAMDAADANQSWGQLAIYPTGDCYLNFNPPSATAGTSFEGVSFSLTNTGNIPLPLANGWSAYSARQVKIGNANSVVRFQGAIRGGTSTTIANLPAGYRPPRTVYLVAGANGPVPVRIIVDPSGAVSFDGTSVSNAAVLLSLDGVSFGI